MATKNVLSLFESQSGVRIDEARLSAPLARKITELDAMLMFLARLQQELVVLKKSGRIYRQLALVSAGPAVLGVILGVAGLVEGVLGILQVAVSLGAAMALFGVEWVVHGYQRTAQAAVVKKVQRIESLSTELEVRLDSVYDEFLAELYPIVQSPPVGARPAAVKQRAKGGAESG
jgi:hypothetical protein